ncbi:MAG: hypothetical protein KME11_21185 [Timaviella obliquedivisa GSE-PSE-MK23-08B]|jgi:hypothetical protein|nr:hypothetical protein [Timaviella obliquedivisa GSE-PSE-MK23-08B]
MNNQENNFVSLESTIFSQDSEQKMSKLVLKLSQALKFFFESMLKVDEPKIYRSRDKSGSSFWTVYDQVTGRRVFFDSEAEVRGWLDRRYYS